MHALKGATVRNPVTRAARRGEEDFSSDLAKTELCHSYGICGGVGAFEKSFECAT